MTGLRVLLILLTLLSSGLAHAMLPFENIPRASDEELDRMRGGFIVNLNGQEFLMAFSIDRLTYINGELVSSISLNPYALTPLSTLQVTTQPPLTQTASASDAVQAASTTTTQATQSTPSGTTAAVTSTPVTTTQAAQSPAPSATTTAVSNSSATTQVATQGTVTIIQNGPGNTVALPSYISANSLSTIIQNTLNNQVISNITVMNATIAARALAAQAQLNGILNQSFQNLH